MYVETANGKALNRDYDYGGLIFEYGYNGDGEREKWNICTKFGYK